MTVPDTAGIGSPAFDRIVEVDPGVRATALLNVTGTLPWFDSHFPRRPILPGVLLTESMIALAVVASADPLLRLRAAEGLRFRRFVTPGDQVRLTVTALDAVEGGVECRWRAVATVGSSTVAAIRTLCLAPGPGTGVGAAAMRPGTGVPAGRDGEAAAADGRAVAVRGQAAEAGS